MRLALAIGSDRRLRSLTVAALLRPTLGGNEASRDVVRKKSRDIKFGRGIKECMAAVADGYSLGVSTFGLPASTLACRSAILRSNPAVRSLCASFALSIDLCVRLARRLSLAAV